MNQEKKGSRTSEAYERIRANILACRLQPNEKLVISDLCERLGVSSGAVREALSRLTSEGLVTMEPHKGFRVTPITQSELEDITLVRTKIESLCLESAIQNASVRWEANIISALHELARIPLVAQDGSGRINQQWADTHRRFHQALVATCDSPWLLRLREILYAQSERYRQYSVPADNKVRDLDKEHREIADAAISRRIDLATALLREHLKKTTTILLESNLVEMEEPMVDRVVQKA